MYYEFYIDVYFTENLILDILILLLTGILLRCRLRILRLLAAGLLGSAGACVPVICPRFRTWPALFLLAAVLGICMMKAAFGISQKRKMVKGMLLFYGMAYLMEGILEILALQITLPVILSGALSVLILWALAALWKRLREKTQMMYDVTLVLGGKSIVLTALKDTGNRLRDPIGNRPVSVGDYTVLNRLLNQTTPVFLIPFYSIGNSGGVLPGFTADYMIIRGENTEVRIDRPVVALSKEPVSQKGEYQLILSPFLAA
ncbi:MAG: sigma-E processing peptidase SpoIIGA [Candidatus Limivivens sp.]|nr:sigma-E processing peptidase SpoIIGA [Candidatus Limivivens sp.]